jgi:hypothetical protein
LLIQVLLLLVLAAALVLTLRRLQQGALTRGPAFAWVALWLAGAAVVLQPDIAARFARFVGVGRGVDAVLYLAVALLFYLTLRIFLRLEQIERDITTLVRAQSLEAERARSREP